MSLSIAVVAGKGGCKKSSLVRALGVRAQHKGFTPLAIDMEFEQASIWRWIQRRKSNGMEGFAVVMETTPGAIAGHMQSADFDCFLIDGPAYASKLTSQLAELADLVCIPLSYTADDAESAARVAAGLIQKGIPRERIRMVFIGVIETKSDRKYKETVEYLKSHDLLHIEGYIPIMDSYAEAQDYGKSLCEVSVPRLRTLARTVVDGIIDAAMQLKGA